MKRKLIFVGLTLVVLAPGFGWWWMIRMPGTSYVGPLPALSSQQLELARELERHVKALALEIGERNTRRYDELRAAADFIERDFRASGYEVARQSYSLRGRGYDNLEVELRGTATPEEIIVVGAHYDSEPGSPGANDNGSGVAAMLALAKRFHRRPQARTLRFVAFVNEEMPHFAQGTMGSIVYARRCRSRGERITAMLSLETMGYFDDHSGSQQYPFPLSWFYPARGNFIAFVGNLSSRALVQRALSTFRQKGAFPSEAGALPAALPGVGWSDHRSFWNEGYPALMVTDTAPFRYPHYHTAEDTPDKINFERLARVVSGLADVVAELGSD